MLASRPLHDQWRSMGEPSWNRAARFAEKRKPTYQGRWHDPAGIASALADCGERHGEVPLKPAPRPPARTRRPLHEPSTRLVGLPNPLPESSFSPDRGVQEIGDIPSQNDSGWAFSVERTLLEKNAAIHVRESA
jgi:hypothetical protein